MRGAAVVALDSPAASGFLPYVLQAATTAVDQAQPGAEQYLLPRDGEIGMFTEYLSVRT